MEVIDQNNAAAAAAASVPAPLPHAGGNSPELTKLPGRAALTWAVLGLALLAAVLIGWWNYQRLQHVERELARRLQQLESERADNVAQQKGAAEQMRELQSRSAMMENKVSEAQAQKATVEKLYAEVTRSRDERALADIESAVSLAAQQLQFTGNVRGAIVALEEADARLASLNQPPALGARRIVQRDLERLRAMPVAEPVGYANRIDNVISVIDQLPLISATETQSPPAGVVVPASGAADGAAQAGDRSGVMGWFARAFAAVRDELGKFVRVQRVDRPDALLLAPDQAYFLRENLKLRLTAARAAALNRQSAMMRSDLTLAINSIDRFFDRNHHEVTTALSTLRNLVDASDRSDTPSLAESLNAIRQLK